MVFINRKVITKLIKLLQKILNNIKAFIKANY